MSLLQRLKDHAEAIRFAEFATLIHDIDKADGEFLRDYETHKTERDRKWVAYGLPDLSISLRALEGMQLAPSLPECDISNSATIRLSDAFIFHHSDVAQPFLSHLVNPGLGGTDGIDSALDKDRAFDDTNDPKRIDTPFGIFEGNCVSNMDDVRALLSGALSDSESGIDQGWATSSKLKAQLMDGLGETRFPCNDVTLWAHSYSVATMTKALLAKVLLEYPDRPNDVPYRLPGREKDLENRTDFGFCRVSLDRSHLWSRAQKAGDLMGAARQVTQLQNALQAFLETELLFGNQVSHFQESQLFLMPRLGTWKSNDKEVLPTDIHDRFVAEVRKRIHEFIVRWLAENQLEDLPFAIDFESDAGTDEPEASDRVLVRTSALLARRPEYRQSAEALAGIQPMGLRCEVCGIRGIGNHAKEQSYSSCRKEKLCGPCYARRHDKGVLDERNLRGRRVTSDLGSLIRDESSRLALVYVALDDRGLYDGSAFGKVRWSKKRATKNPSLGRLDRSRETMAKFLYDIAEEYKRFPLTLESTSDYTAFIVAANDVGERGLLDRIYTEYEKRFGKFRDVLPLSVGVVFFYKKFPLYVVADILRSLRESLQPGEETRYTVTDPGYRDGAKIATMVLETGPMNGRGSLSEPAVWRVPAVLSNGDYDPYHPQFGGKRLRDLPAGHEVPAREGRFDFILAESAQTRYAFAGASRRHHILGERPSYSISAIPQFQRLQGLLANLGHSQVSQIEGLLVEKMLSWGDAWWAPENDGIIQGFCRTAIMSPNAFGARDRNGKYPNLGQDQEADENLLLNAARNGMLLDAIDLYYHMLNSGQANDKAAANDRG